jgi:hypothetical protein
MGRYSEADLRGLKRTSIERRSSKVAAGELSRPATDPDSFAQFWDGLPDLLAGRDLRRLSSAILAARRDGRPVVWMFGAHVVKVGLGPLLVRLLEEDLATLFAVNGAFAIHDAELALWGATSEDVAAELPLGRFGMARETAEFVNGAAVEARQGAEGLGEALGRLLLARRDAWRAPSVLGACYARGTPATVHVAIGTDIVHQHPEFSGEAAGDASARDFRILAGHLAGLEGAVVLNVGSAVLLPEVFLKACSVAINLGASPARLFTATLDFTRNYRSMENVVRRPPGEGGGGCYLVGHHEILLPMLFQGLLLERRRASSVFGRQMAAP